ncbi:hypothetical protein AVEN_18359-1 [Araneus ventricosus]|uniref:Uncharacterized protein n=1 Tax=Araneus ventricosus TaxID=182803 RepID=A0A4Y2HQE5_ARAVE|nr:hypothetical protein AVEN_18359-1 [Araneus ventricosus]
MTTTTSELSPPLQVSAPHQREGVWPLPVICVQQVPYTTNLHLNLVEPGTLLTVMGRGRSARPLGPQSSTPNKFSKIGPYQKMSLTRLNIATWGVAAR